jgi:serine/threonine protein kinase
MIPLEEYPKTKHAHCFVKLLRYVYTFILLLLLLLLLFLALTIRIFFYIFQGLDTLKTLRICHGRLSWTNVLIRDTEDGTGQINNSNNNNKKKKKHVTLAGLGAGALRLPDDEAGSSSNKLIQPSSLTGCMAVVGCGTDPMYVAPEVFAGQAFDGAAIDLWAASVMLFVMLVGMQQQQPQPQESDEGAESGNNNEGNSTKRPRMEGNGNISRGSSRSLLFAAPVPADWRFTEICVKGHLRQLLLELGGGISSIDSVNNDGVDFSPAVVDLLQGLLHANPADRLTLQQVQAHPWLSSPLQEEDE